MGISTMSEQNEQGGINNPLTTIVMHDLKCAFGRISAHNTDS